MVAVYSRMLLMCSFWVGIGWDSICVHLDVIYVLIMGGLIAVYSRMSFMCSFWVGIGWDGSCTK